MKRVTILLALAALLGECVGERMVQAGKAATAVTAATGMTTAVTG